LRGTQLHDQRVAIPRHALENPILRVQRFAGEEQLRDALIRVTTNIEVDVWRSKLPPSPDGPASALRLTTPTRRGAR
jgi:hypothetical protein